MVKTDFPALADIVNRNRDVKIIIRANIFKNGFMLASGENNLHESGEIKQKKSKEKSHYQF